MLCRCKPSTDTFNRCKTRIDTRLVSPDNSMIEMMIGVDDDDHSRMRQGLKTERCIVPKQIHAFMILCTSNTKLTDLVLKDFPVMLGVSTLPHSAQILMCLS